MDDRYLWDRGGQPDPEIERLESLLGRFRAPESPLRLPARRRVLPRALLASAAIAAAAIGAAWVAGSVLVPRWRVEKVAGAPLLASRPITAGGWMPVGAEIETDGGSRAKIAIGTIAEIEVEPLSRLRLVGSGPLRQRLALDRGRISAKISAPPRLFVVETPSARAVDLGCEYTLEMGSAGTGLLRVETGWVSFERGGRESIVPAGAVCATRSREGPGTPYYEDALPEFRSALQRYDFEGGGAGAVEVLLASARKRDGLTLWHLLSRSDSPLRERLYDRFAALVPPPPEVTRAGVLAGDERMLERWRWELEGMPLLSRGDGLLSVWRRYWFALASRHRPDNR